MIVAFGNPVQVIHPTDGCGVNPVYESESSIYFTGTSLEPCAGITLASIERVNPFLVIVIILAPPSLYLHTLFVLHLFSIQTLY